VVKEPGILFFFLYQHPTCLSEIKYQIGRVDNGEIQITKVELVSCGKIITGFAEVGSWKAIQADDASPQKSPTAEADPIHF
jgi:hypothetical protein